MNNFSYACPTCNATRLITVNDSDFQCAVCGLLSNFDSFKTFRSEAQLQARHDQYIQKQIKREQRDHSDEQNIILCLSTCGARNSEEISLLTETPIGRVRGALKRLSSDSQISNYRDGSGYVFYSLISEAEQARTAEKIEDLEEERDELERREARAEYNYKSYIKLEALADLFISEFKADADAYNSPKHYERLLELSALSLEFSCKLASDFKTLWRSSRCAEKDLVILTANLLKDQISKARRSSAKLADKYVIKQTEITAQINALKGL